MKLELKEISYRYPGSVGDVFQQLSCQVTEPGFHALFGPSGVGKTTLAKMIAGTTSNRSFTPITSKGFRAGTLFGSIWNQSRRTPTGSTWQI